MGRTRRRFSAALTARVAIEAIKGHRSVAQLAGEHQLLPGQIAQWKQQLLSSAERVFADGRTSEKKDQEELVARLYQQIGQLKVELDVSVAFGMTCRGISTGGISSDPANCTRKTRSTPPNPGP